MPFPFAEESGPRHFVWAKYGRLNYMASEPFSRSCRLASEVQFGRGLAEQGREGRRADDMRRSLGFNFGIADYNPGRVLIRL
jgi:hypothetical protein